jgi:hypothetical protein
MNHVVYNDNLCKVEIVPCLTGYGWFVVVDEDPEHCHSTYARTFDEAMREAANVYETLEDENAQFGVGA